VGCVWCWGVLGTDIDLFYPTVMVQIPETTYRTIVYVALRTYCSMGWDINRPECETEMNKYLAPRETHRDVTPTSVKLQLVYRTVVPFVYRTVVPFMYRTVVPFVYRTVVPFVYRTVVPFVYRTVIPFVYRTVVPFMFRTVVPFVYRTVVPFVCRTVVPLV
jgi:hypothetical protein